MMDIKKIVRLEETRISSAVREVAKYSMETEGGGVACRGEPGEWTNCAYGLGLNGPVSVDGFKKIIDYYRDHGIEPRLELNPFVGEETIRNCGEAGFQVKIFENVLYRLLSKDDVYCPLNGYPDGVEYRITDNKNESELRTHCAVAMSGFIENPTEEDFATWKRMLQHPKIKAVAAWCEGKMVGAGAVEIHDEIAALISLSVLKEYRGRGIQQGLISKRLEMARAHGVKVATIGSIAGAATDRNVMRMGFQIAYTKLIMIFPEKGLVGAL
ncbi:MAG: GNAT family N-acetyltransferase [Bdellovibrionota bacterium]